MQEIWKDVVGYEGLYEVNEYGNIRRTIDHYMMKHHLDRYGYLYACLTKNGKQKKHKIHRLVAYAFLPKGKTNETINHKDLNTINNHYSNLEWMTVKENVRYSQSQKIIGKSINDNSIIILDAIRDCTKYGFDRRSIQRALNGEYSHHHGYKWQYAKQ